MGHLRSEEFVDAIEGLDLPADRHAHLDGCTSCLSQLRSLASIHASLASDDEIAEPDWGEFRGTVRSELLSRSIQRESALWRWTGWSIRPVMAWGLSFVLLIGAATGGFYLHILKDAAKPPVQEEAMDGDSQDAAQETSWTNTSFFDELSTLEEPQVERLRLMLESEQKGTLARQ